MYKSKLWTKDFIINTMLNFIFYLVCYLLMVIIGSYAMNSFHTSPSIAGILSGIFIVGGFFGRIITGSIIEQVGQKKILYIGLIFYLVMTLLYFVTVNLPFLLVIRFFHGVGFGIASTTCGTIVANITPKDRRGEGIGYYALSVTLASAFGPFLGIFLFEHGNFNLILIACVIAIMISCIVAPFLTIPKVENQNQQVGKLKQKQVFSLQNFFEKKAIPISVVTFFVGMSYSGIVSFLATYTNKIGISSAGSIFFIVYAIFILISRPITGRLFDKKGDNFVMYPAFILFAIGLALVSQAHTGFILLLASAFVGLGYGTITPCAQTIAVKNSPRNRIGLATSTFFGLFDIGMGFGPFILGLFIPMIGYRGLYICIAIAVIAFMFLYFVLHGRKYKETIGIKN